jgi:hypothetical protein
MLTRRRFSQLLIGSPLLAANSFGCAAGAAPVSGAQDMGAALTQSRDLLIKGGTVIDPSQNLHALLDVAVKDGKILQVAPDIPADGSRTVISAKGKIVTPGLIDVHVHVFEGVGPTGVNADQYCLGRGVTTAVDAGSAGYFHRRIPPICHQAFGHASLRDDRHWGSRHAHGSCRELFQS